MKARRKPRPLVARWAAGERLAGGESAQHIAADARQVQWTGLRCTASKIKHPPIPSLPMPTMLPIMKMQLALAVVLLTLAAGVRAEDEVSPKPIDFNRDIRPILSDN